MSPHRVRSTRLLALCLALSAAALVGGGLAADDPAGPTSTTTATQPQAKAPVMLDAERFAFMAGRWVQTDGEERTEEHWSAPHGDTVMGMFRWCNGPKTVMVEALTITAEADKDGNIQPVLRLRHFSAKLEPWKSEPNALALRYDAEKSGPNDALFVAYATTDGPSAGSLHSVQYTRPEPDRFQIVVSFAKDSGQEPLKFDMRKEP